MKIIDCFIYNNEDLILDLRLNSLNTYVDSFVIVEAKFSHTGKEKNKYNFDLKKFENFQNKIKYLQIENFPNNLTNKLIGVNMKKYRIIIIIGAITFPKISPNLIHPLFNGVNILEFNNPKAKKIKAVVKR